MPSVSNVNNASTSFRRWIVKFPDSEHLERGTYEVGGDLDAGMGTGHDLLREGHDALILRYLGLFLRSQRDGVGAGRRRIHFVVLCCGVVWCIVVVLGLCCVETRTFEVAGRKDGRTFCTRSLIFALTLALTCKRGSLS